GRRVLFVNLPQGCQAGHPDDDVIPLDARNTELSPSFPKIWRPVCIDIERGILSAAGLDDVDLDIGIVEEDANDVKRLVLFSELYMTFEKQKRYGLFVRNLSQYIKFMERNELDELYIFTYGAEDVEALMAAQRAGTFPAGFRVLAPPRWLTSRTGQIIYSFIGPFIHGGELRKADVFRTHQVAGSWAALIAKILCKKPLLFRLGYPL